MTKNRVHPAAWPFGLGLFLIAAGAQARDIEVTVLDRDGNSVSGVAVYVMHAGIESVPNPGSAVMDQRDTRFVPHLLVVQKGTSVEFPNSDIVAHHVYSFSKPNNFVLPLYKGDPHKPVVFQHDGIVTLGCNIHDNMLGYIVIVDTPAFGVTRENGAVTVELDDAVENAVAHIWNPRIRDNDLSRKISADDHNVVFTLEKKLRPSHDSESGAIEWSEY